jgi:Protein of unknown function (DUF3604)
MSQRWLLALLLVGSIPVRADVGVRVLLGLMDRVGKKWDGSASIDRGKITKIDPWRFGKDDEIASDGSWKVSTAPVLSFLALIQRQTPPVGPNGVILWLSGEDENSEVSVKTAQGSFSFKLADLPYGKFHYALEGNAAVDRIPPSWRLTDSPDEQDYPAAAVSTNGDIWVAYVEFKHHPDHDKLRAPYQEKPKDLSVLAAPAQGDQILVKRFTANRWEEPIAITPPGGDLYRPAIALDGSGRPWVFWSANRNNNFDLWARAIENGKPGKTVQISNAPGSDVFPAAATDSSGRVWVAWQGWRQGKGTIFAATQDGTSFSDPSAISESTGNEWNPAIAADSSGRVSVAWDSYRNGSYDVYARTATAPGQWGNEIPVAATPLYEAYPSIAYDAQGRLWIAYEVGPDNWGKDFGAHRSTGVSIYESRGVRLVGLDRAGNLVRPAVDPDVALQGLADIREDGGGRQGDIKGWERSNPETFTQRASNAHPWPGSNPRNSLPRLTVDASGRIWLAFRSMHPAVWTPIGTSWSEYVISYDGKAWTGPAYIFRSDNTLDNRPALVSQRGGELVVIGSSDSRREIEFLLKKGWDLRSLLSSAIPDPYNNDLYASVLNLPPAAVPVPSREIGPPPAPAVVTESDAERAATAEVRGYSVNGQDGKLKIVRGEFHRHSEISMDGGLDGTLIDQWRYILDAAALDWVGCCDHDNGGGREYSWWTTQKLTDIFYAPGKFAPLFAYERSVSYPEGHRNVLFAQRGIRPLPRLPKVDETSTGHAPDTLLFYEYLRKFNGLTASHTSATDMGTDWRDNDPEAEPVVEIYQGMRQNYEMPDAPRSNSATDSIGGWRPKGFVNLALEKGYKLGFEASSDHISTHQSYANVLVTDDTRESLMDALRKRHVYASTEQIVADVRSGPYLMGDVFSTAEAPNLHVKLSGSNKFSKVVIVKDNEYVYSTEPGSDIVEFSWRDNAPSKGKTSYYYVRGEQDNGELVWVSPMWITYTGK